MNKQAGPYEAPTPDKTVYITVTDLVTTAPQRDRLNSASESRAIWQDDDQRTKYFRVSTF